MLTVFLVTTCGGGSSLHDGESNLHGIRDDSGNKRIKDIINGINFYSQEVPAGRFNIKQDWNGVAPETGKTITMTITKPYYMTETEVTQELWEAVMGTGDNNPSWYDNSELRKPEKGEVQKKRPVENVSWHDALVFCNKLSKAMGLTSVYSVEGEDLDNMPYKQTPAAHDRYERKKKWDNAVMNENANGYRLPTEMEWMWAAMGADVGNVGKINVNGYKKLYAGQKDIGNVRDVTKKPLKLGDYAWYGYSYRGGITTGAKTHQVGIKLPNELGLYDMSGNVWEWCWDCDSSSLPDSVNNTVDYRGPTNVGKFDRIVRGSSFNSGDCALSFRANAPTQYWADFIGFRIVRQKP